MLSIISMLSIFISMVYYEKTLSNGTKTNFKNKNKNFNQSRKVSINYSYS